MAKQWTVLKNNETCVLRNTKFESDISKGDWNFDVNFVIVKNDIQSRRITVEIVDADLDVVFERSFISVKDLICCGDFGTNFDVWSDDRAADASQNCPWIPHGKVLVKAAYKEISANINVEQVPFKAILILQVPKLELITNDE